MNPYLLKKLLTEAKVSTDRDSRRLYHDRISVEARRTHADAPDPARADGHRLPSQIVVGRLTRGSSVGSDIVFSRKEAETLQVLLEDALTWDGVAP